MMRKAILTLSIMLLPLLASAQQLHFGYFSYQEVFKSMAGYSIAMKHIDDLKKQYDAEMKRVEEEFNKKYEEFLDGQKDFAPSIREKRQAELQEMMEKNIAFKQEARRLIRQAEEEAMAPLKERLSSALNALGKEKGYAFIINTDNNTLPFVNDLMGEDISVPLKERLK